QAERLSFLAVDIEKNRGIGRREGRKNAGEPWVLIGGANKPLHYGRHGRRILPLQSFELILKAAAGGKADDRRQVEGDDISGANAAGRFRNVGDQGLGGIVWSCPFRERLEMNHD